MDKTNCLIHTPLTMNLECVVLSERNQIQKVTFIGDCGKHRRWKTVQWFPGTRERGRG